MYLHPYEHVYTHACKNKGVFLRFGVVVSLFTGAQLDELRALALRQCVGFVLYHLRFRPLDER